MSFSTGVTARDDMIARSIKEALACHSEISVESLSTFLPADFSLDSDEVEGFLSNMEQPVPEPEPVPEQHRGNKPKPMIDRLPDGRPFVVSPEPLKKIEAPRASEAAQPHQDAPQTAPEPMPSGEYIITDPVAERVMPKIAEHQARLALDVANQRLSRARDRMVVARGVLQQRRADLAAAIMRWQILGNNLDNKNDAVSRSNRQQTEIRNHLASTQAERERRAKLKIKNNTAKTFVQRQMVNGPSRGAFDRSAAARVGYFNRDPRRGAVVKVPSDQ